jgi:nitrogen fixation protein NifU and related proteins
VSLDDLYREVILDHYSHPRNRGVADPADVVREGANPLCGDEIRVSLRVRDGLVEDLRFDGRGCSISQASASMMTERLKGHTVGEAARVIAAFKALMHADHASAQVPEDLGDLESLQGVRKFPVRVKCATLPWVTLEMALAELDSTETPPQSGDRPAAETAR